MALTHEPRGKPGGPGLYGMKNAQHSAYFQHIVNDLVESGHTEDRAYSLAWGILRNYAAGHDGKGNRVHPDTQAKAVAALAEEERLRAKAKATRSGPMDSQRAMMTAAGMNDLPDSDFAYIEPGGSKDSSGRTVPRSLRHFPIHDAAHIRNALARLPQSNLSTEQKAQAMKKIRAAAKDAGVEVGGGDGESSSASRAAPSEIFRYYPLDDIRIMRAAEGSPSGRVVEAYATVFDEPAEIHDGQGHYMEVIDRTAFDDTLARISRSRGGLASAIRVLFNHGKTMEGVPAPEFQRPLGKPLEVRPDGRGLLTRTEYANKPFAEEILDDIREGRITGQSFVGGIIRSDPELRPGNRYGRRGGALTTVRRMALGLREYGPVLYGSYTGAEFLGIRMASPGGPIDDFDSPEDVEGASANEEQPAADTREEVVPSRLHAHRLWQLRTEELCRQAGLILPGRETA